MKFSVSIVIIVLMVGLLAPVQPVGAVQATMNGNNWTNINNIWDSLGMSFLKNSSLLAGGNITLTKHVNGSVSIASGGSGCTDCPNATVAANLANWNATNFTDLNTKVNKSGDTMIGNLLLNYTNPGIILKNAGITKSDWITIGNDTYLESSDGDLTLQSNAGSVYIRTNLSDRIIINHSTMSSLVNITLPSGYTVDGVDISANLDNWNATYNASYAKGGFGFSIENGTNVIETGYSNNLTTIYAGSIVKLIAHSAETGSLNVSFWNATAGNTYIDSVLITAGTDGNKTLNYAFGDETRIMYNVTSVSDIKKVMITGKIIKS